MTDSKGVMKYIMKGIDLTVNSNFYKALFLIICTFFQTQWSIKNFILLYTKKKYLLNEHSNNHYFGFFLV